MSYEDVALEKVSWFLGGAIRQAAGKAKKYVAAGVEAHKKRVVAKNVSAKATAAGAPSPAGRKAIARAGEIDKIKGNLAWLKSQESLSRKGKKLSRSKVKGLKDKAKSLGGNIEEPAAKAKKSPFGSIGIPLAAGAGGFGLGAFATSGGRGDEYKLSTFWGGMNYGENKKPRGYNTKNMTSFKAVKPDKKSLNPALVLPPVATGNAQGLSQGISSQGSPTTTNPGVSTTGPLSLGK